MTNIDMQPREMPQPNNNRYYENNIGETNKKYMYMSLEDSSHQLWYTCTL